MLDIIKLPLLAPKPKPYQPENWLLDPHARWERAGRLNWRDLPRFTDRPRALWENGFNSLHGMNDRVPVEAAAALPGSLFLVHLDEIELYVLPASDARAKPQLRGRFRYAGVNHILSVTDPAIEYRYLPAAMDDGVSTVHMIGECYATVSLGEPFQGHYYKLLAAIIKP